ncbi:MAG: tetratricopeptide repeat protein [Candidatus Thorarchaeota archaeon]
MFIGVGESEPKTKGFFRNLKQFERKRAILIGVSISLGIFLIISSIISGIFLFVYKVIEVAWIIFSSSVAISFLFIIGGTYYSYGPIHSLMRKGERFQKDGKTDLALGYYNRASEIRPASSQPILRIVSIYEQMGGLDKSIEFCKELISTRVPENAKFYQILSGLYLRNKDYSYAKESIEKALKLDPDNHEYMVMLAGIHFALDEYESVLNICNVIVNNKLKNKGMWIKDALINARALNLITQVYLSQNDREKLMELAKQNNSVLGALGFLHYEAGEYEKAIEYYQECLKHNKNNVVVWNNLGAAYNKIGQFDLAIEALQESIKIRKIKMSLIKESVDFPLFHGTHYLMDTSGDIIEYKESAITYNHLGFAYYNLGQFSKALDAVNYSLKLDSNFERAWYTLALIYIKTDCLSEALESCEKAIEINPRYKEALELKENLLNDKRLNYIS